ncbi:helix-turn-helix domain-containing protein [Megasphaera sp. DISK 18]|uniref:helix-turn-helix domain-containing protein n=1 Tax=Megasphaera sp. DISK 18 TaxID=1776081 RepID=UPI0009F60F55|nr:helix-turn-helix domain-containing protein [Megasphaera sp. DISK 18]
MSQEELATFLGTSKQVISRYETNQRIPKITTVQEYAMKLKVPLLYFMDNSPLSFDVSSSNETSSDVTPSPVRQISTEELEILFLYTQLDEVDRAEIRGEMRGILRADKYVFSSKKE